MVPRQRGQATVELVLCLPLVALLIALISDVGMIAADRARLQHAAREAARVAAVDADEDDIRRAVAELDIDAFTLEVDPPANYRVQGEPVAVRLEWEPQGIVPFLSRTLLHGPLAARAVMRIEQP